MQKKVIDVQQHFKQECDINHIMSKYRQTGLVTHTSRRTPRYGDFVNVPQNFQDVQRVVLNAQRSFDCLPADIRKKFNFDVASFVDFVANPLNVNSLKEMGLLPPSPVIDTEGDASARPVAGDASPKVSKKKSEPVSGEVV